MKKKLPLIFCVLIAGLYLLLKFGLPGFAKGEAQTALSKQLGRSVTIQDISWEPLLLSLSIEDIRIDDKPFLNRAFVDISYLKLFQKNIHISKLEIDGLKTKIIKVKGKYQAEILSKMKKPEAVKEKKKDEDSDFDWPISLNTFELKESLIELPRNNNFKINSIKASHFHSQTQSKKAAFDLNLELNKSKILLTGDLKNYLKNPEVNAKIKISNLDLSILSQVNIKGITRVNGILSVDSTLSVLPNKFDALSQIKLTDFALYSENKQIVNYSAKSIELKQFSLIKSDTLTATIDTLKSDNLVLSIPAKAFKGRTKLSKFAKIELKKTVFNMPNDQNCKDKKELLSFSTLYNGEGKIKATKICKGMTKDFKLVLDSIDLVPLSETFEHSLSYHVETGKLNLKLKTLTKNKKVDGNAVVQMNHLSLDDSNERGQKIKNSSSLPLATAISLIRDDKGRIEAEMDISGNEDSPNFGFLAMLRKGIGSLILSKLSVMIATKAATQFLPMLLSSVPFSPTNAFYIAKGGFNFITKPRFKDIQFFSNEEKIKKDGLKQISDLAKLLKKNKAINFTICPVASTREGIDKDSDKKNSSDEVLDLAKIRVQKIREALSLEKVSLKQVIFCRPKISDDHIEFGSASISF